jgi:HK97 family phage major capsid protein
MPETQTQTKGNQNPAAERGGRIDFTGKGPEELRREGERLIGEARAKAEASGPRMSAETLKEVEGMLDDGAAARSQADVMERLAHADDLARDKRDEQEARNAGNVKPRELGDPHEIGSAAGEARGWDGASVDPELRYGLVRRRHSGREERSIVLRGEERVLEPGTPDWHRADPAYAADYRHWLYTGEQRATLQKGLAAQGGVLLPMQMIPGVMKALDESLFIAEQATVFNTPVGTRVGIRTLESDPDDGGWEGDVTESTEDTGTGFGGRELDPKRIEMSLPVSNTLLNAGVGVEQFLVQRLDFGLRRTIEKGAMTGNGANQPLGLFTVSDQGIPSSRDIVGDNSATAFTADTLMQTYTDIEQQYKSDPSFSWVMSRAALLNAMQLKDGDGRYIYQLNQIQGRPDQLLGVPLRISEHAPNTFSANALVALLGALRYYVMQITDIGMIRDPYSRSTKNTTIFVPIVFADGMPWLSAAFRRVKLGT